MSDTYEPVIVGFLCTWCSYRAADQAGMARTSGVSNLYSVRVPCSGRVDPEFILEAFRNGADGVLVVGCLRGSCHYVDGNQKAIRRLILLRRLTEQLGIERERIQGFWVSAAEGLRLATFSERMCRQLRALGPLRWNQERGASSSRPKLEKVAL